MDSSDRAAGTAYWIAAARAQESAREDRLFDDPFAEALAGEIGRRILAAAELASGGANPFLPARTRWFDDLVRAEAGGVRQVVVLGAGFDTRPMRLPVPTATIWFEIDTAQVFAAKEPVLAALGAFPKCRRIAVVADLRDDWAERLTAADFEPGVATLWLAEGVLFYLDAGSVAALIARAAELSGAGSSFAADLFGTGLLRRRDWGSAPPFCSDDPGALFSGAGWPVVRLEEPWQGPARARFRAGSMSSNAAPDPSDRAWFVLARDSDD